jgi:hypothetical protein
MQATCEAAGSGCTFKAADLDGLTWLYSLLMLASHSAGIGLGRIVDLYCRSSTLHRIN